MLNVFVSLICSTSIVCSTTRCFRCIVLVFLSLSDQPETKKVPPSDRKHCCCLRGGTN